MNYMDKQVKSEIKEMKALSKAIGDFIHYWGFRRIHGEIWAQVFLSTKPLSGADLVKRLKVSKALISPALKQLIRYKLIKPLKSNDAREKLYEVNPDFLDIIKTVLQDREVPMLAKVQLEYFKVHSKLESDNTTHSVHAQRFQDLGNMINQANLVLAVFMQMNSFDELQVLANMYKKEK
jgi:HTH-type transcriptional regulator, glycine betaine synthesis regulator